MEQILGTQEFARLYFEGDMNDIKDALTERLGREAANNIMEIRMGIFGGLRGVSQELETTMEIAQQAKLAGINVAEI